MTRNISAAKAIVTSVWVLGATVTAATVTAATVTAATVTAATALACILPLAFALAAEPEGNRNGKTRSPVRQKQPEDYQEELVEWILEDPGGFFHHSIRWQRLGPDGKTGPYAMHATEDIPGGTPLIVLPRKYVIESHTDQQKNKDAYNIPQNDSRMCITVEKMLVEYIDHTNPQTTFRSFYAPYLSYLFDRTVGGTTRGLLPSTWSEHAKDVVSLITHTDEEDGDFVLRPHQLTYNSIFDICSNNIGYDDDEYEDDTDSDNDSDSDSDLSLADNDNEDDDMGGQASKKSNGNGQNYSKEDDNNNNSYPDKNHSKEDDRSMKTSHQPDPNQSDDLKNASNNSGETNHQSDPNGNGPNKDIDVDDQMAEDAYMFLLSRGWYDKLLPVVDMLNHRSGPNRNVEVTPIDDLRGNDVAAYAWRDIRKGEQLQYSYSECMDDTCGFGRYRYSTSTQYIFVEYGFVELYPRRWIFDTTDLDDKAVQELLCEVTTDPDDGTKMVFHWIFDTPNEASITWMEEQLTRLKSIESRVKKGLSELELMSLREGHNIEHERDTILEYYEAYIEAFELALEHKDDPVALTREGFEEELRELQRSVGRQAKTIDDLRTHELLLLSSKSEGAATTTTTTTNAIPRSDEL